MINSTVENNKLEEEIINLRNENQMLKEQLRQADINSETIHNNSYNTNYTNNTTERKIDKLRKQQLRDMFDNIGIDRNIEDGYSNMSEEDIANGYMEMGNRNLELSQANLTN